MIESCSDGDCNLSLEILPRLAPSDSVSRFEKLRVKFEEHLKELKAARNQKRVGKRVRAAMRKLSRRMSRSVMPSDTLRLLQTSAFGRMTTCDGRPDCWSAALWRLTVLKTISRTRTREFAFVRNCTKNCVTSLCSAKMVPRNTEMSSFFYFFILFQKDEFLKDFEAKSAIASRESWTASDSEIIPLSVVIPGLCLDSLSILFAVVTVVLALVWRSFSGNVHYLVILALIILSQSLSFVVNFFHTGTQFVGARIIRIVFDRLTLMILMVILVMLLVPWTRIVFDLFLPERTKTKKIVVACLIGVTCVVGAYTIACIVISSMAWAGWRVSTSTAYRIDKSGIVVVIVDLAFSLALAALSVFVLVHLTKSKDQRRIPSAWRQTILLTLMFVAIAVKAGRILYSFYGDEDYIPFAAQILAGYSIPNFVLFCSATLMILLTFLSNRRMRVVPSDVSTEVEDQDTPLLRSVPKQYEI